MVKEENNFLCRKIEDFNVILGEKNTLIDELDQTISEK